MSGPGEGWGTASGRRERTSGLERQVVSAILGPLVSLEATSGSTLRSAMSRAYVTSWLHCWSSWMTVSMSSPLRARGAIFSLLQRRGCEPHFVTPWNGSVQVLRGPVGDHTKVLVK